MKVILKEDYDSLLEGSVIEVEKVLKTKYKGIFSSMMGSYNVVVPKKICKRYKEAEAMKAVNDYFKKMPKKEKEALAKRWDDIMKGRIVK